MNESTTERMAIWDAFLARWPRDSLKNMGLREYSQAGNQDNFCYWVEAKTESLGSIWGGSSFKFGVFSRDNKSPKINDRTRCYSPDYGWLAKYGDSAETAYEQVKSKLIQVAQAAQTGNLALIDQLDLGPALKWKIAFLYQDRDKPCILPIYKTEYLQAALGSSEKKVSILQQELIKEIGGRNFLEYGIELWGVIQEKLSTELTPEDAHQFLENSGKFSQIKAPTQKIAGYQSNDGQQLALALDNKRTTLYLSTGDWLEEVKSELLDIATYSPDKSRSSNLSANTPNLAIGNAIVKVVAPTKAALIALCDAYANSGLEDKAPVSTNFNKAGAITMQPLNQILYGPPGTGKTHATIDEALKILDPDFLNQHSYDRELLKGHFDEMVKEKLVRFVTFHQSFSYEDFVEGIRALTNDDKQLEYQVEPGIFKRLCDDARTHGAQPDAGIRNTPRIWKISIDGAGAAQTPTQKFCFDHSEARIGWGDTGDLNLALDNNSYYKNLGSGDRGTLRYFAEEIVPGDILLCIHSAENIGAVGVVTGDYRYEQITPTGVRGDYKHVRPVKWLYRDLQLSILPLNDDKQFTLKTVYLMERFSWGDLLAYLQKSGVQPVEPSKSGEKRKPHVLIIDEINRGNISRIFGELITLIEPSKREGRNEALSVDLPYSKRPFSVPDNVYLIGTMNTADRSLAGLDIALRRRFTFKEMPPRPDLLKNVEVEGLDIGQLLLVMNQRIEVMLDRDHCLGHAYFIEMKAQEEKRTLNHLAFIFRHNILPLLQEYFFEDWERIRWVLNDHNCQSGIEPFIRQPSQDRNLEKLFGSNVATSLRDNRWEINENAFDSINSYKNILGTGA
jgi:5-methylcytosine-specific restriction protein B